MAQWYHAPLDSEESLARAAPPPPPLSPTAQAWICPIGLPAK